MQGLLAATGKPCLMAFVPARHTALVVPLRVIYLPAFSIYHELAVR